MKSRPGIFDTKIQLPRSLMKVGALFVAAGLAAAGVAGTATLDPTAPLTADAAAQLSQSVNRPVIVIMKHQLTGDDAANDQAPVMNELAQVKATRIKPFRMVNSFA